MTTKKPVILYASNSACPPQVEYDPDDSSLIVSIHGLHANGVRSMHTILDADALVEQLADVPYMRSVMLRAIAERQS